MADRISSVESAAYLRGLGVSWVAMSALLGSLGAQDPAPSAVTYNVDPAAAAGMASSTPSGATYRQAEMMQVRISAQDAMGDAAAASLARSADQSIEMRNRDIALENARTNKAIKDEMRNRLKHDRIAAVHNKVTSNEMSTWEQNGGVRVERNVPDAFLMSLIQEEEQAAARAAESGGRKGLPFLSKGREAGEAGVSFLGAIRPPRLPFTGGGGSEQNIQSTVAASSPPSSDDSEPVFAKVGGSSSSGSTPAPAASKPGSVPMISGAALVDGRSPVSTQSADRPPAESRSISFADGIPEGDKKKSKLFSRAASEPDDDSFMPSSTSTKTSSGFLGFGKKKVVVPAGSIDAGLFPTGSVDQAPRGGQLTSSGASRVSEFASDVQVSSASSGSFELPSQSQTVEKARSGFSLPKPSLPVPSIPTLSKSEGSGGGGSVSAGTYVVTSTAQFMVYGEEQMHSEIRALPAGTTVMVVKPGDQWAGIRLSDGTEGIVQNKFLRPGR